MASVIYSLLPLNGLSFPIDKDQNAVLLKVWQQTSHQKMPRVEEYAQISCTYLQGANQLVFNFEENLGDVTIFVTTNLPGIQYMEFADSSHETYVLELFDHSDTYYITVEASTGELYSAELSVTAPTHLVVVTHDTTGNIVLKEVQAINQ